MLKPFPCIFDVALDLAVRVAARSLGGRYKLGFLPLSSPLPPLPPTSYLAALGSICLHSCFSQSGPWLTFNSALTDTGRRLSKRGAIK